MDTINFKDLNLYAGELNDALRNGLGISFHNNNGLIARNPAGIQLANWDVIASFFRWGECPSCNGGGTTFSGIEGPFMEEIFFAEEEKLCFGYRDRISMPRIAVSGLRTIPIKKDIVTQWNSKYGPIIGRMEAAPEHTHDGQIQAYRFTDIKRLSFG